MKKFYLLLVALCAALSMNAAVEQLYMIDNFSGNDYNVSTGRAMTKIADGVFEIKSVEVTTDGKCFSFAENVGSWDVINSNRFGAKNNEDRAFIGEIEMIKTNYNSWKINAGTYVFKVDTNNMTLTITDGSGDEPIGTTRTDDWDIWGNLDDSGWKAFDMNCVESNIWEATIEVTKTSDAQFNFKYFADKNNTNNVEWYGARVSYDNVVLDLPMEVVTGPDSGDNPVRTNFKFKLSAGKYIFRLDADAKKLTIADPVKFNFVSYAIRTNIFSENEELVDYDLELNGDTWQYAGEVTSNGSFFIVGFDEDGNGTTLGASLSGTATNVNCPLSLVAGDNAYVFNRHITSGDLANFRNFSFIVNPDTKTVMLLRVGAPIYLIGTFGGEWDTASTSHKMTNVTGTHTYYNEEFVEFNSNSGSVYFVFTSTPSAKWDEVNVGRYGPGLNDINLADVNYKYQIKKHTNDKVFTVPTNTRMRSVINLDTRYNEFYRDEDLRPDKIYLHGDLWGHRFDWNGPDSATKQDSGNNDGSCFYEFIGMLIEDHGDGNGYFVLSDWHKSAGAQSVRARAAAEGEAEGLTDEVAANGHAYTQNPMVLLKNTYRGNEGLVTVEPNKHYDITLKMNGDGTVDEIKTEVNTSLTTGVEAVDVEDVNAPVEYYNMQGVRVANPENGVYIRRKGNRVTKVVL